MKYLLFTQCLQNDFVAPLPKGASLPNGLHIGRAESRRLLGDPEHDWAGSGPLARFLAAWQRGAGAQHAAIHIRDWHDPREEGARPHLDFFGLHCLKGTDGARFVAPLEALIIFGHDTHVVESAVLSDFSGTDLLAKIERLTGAEQELRAGIIGVWTDFKVRYLAYDLLTRTRVRDIALCSALCASRSRIHHRQALEHLAVSLGLTVIDSIPEFQAWLGLAASAAPPPVKGRPAPGLSLPEGAALADEERRLIEYLFRDCREVRLEPLSGGFSGSRVFRSRSVDRRGLTEIPFVVKIDSHRKIAQERVAVESIENMLGAASPRLAEYVDLETLGAIKYHFATMHAGEVTTLKQAFVQAADATAVKHLMLNVIGRVLRRLYQRPELDRLGLFSYYSYRRDYNQATLARVSALAAREEGDRVTLIGLKETLPHPRVFYARLAQRQVPEPEEVPCCLVHGDLNLANILLDTSGNTWLIDYFWTRMGHALQDLAKLENDLKFIMVPLADDEALRRAVRWEQTLVEGTDLLRPPAGLAEELAADPAIAKAHAAIGLLRSLAAALLEEAGSPAPVSPLQYWIAQLRYSAHTMSFDECDARQQRFALASTCLLADRLAQSASS